MNEPKWHDDEVCHFGAETLLGLWQQRKTQRPYLFHARIDLAGVADVETNFVMQEAKAMHTYVVLMKLTDQGIRATKDSPDRIEAGIKSLEALGGKVGGFYATLGEYDYVACVEAPNEAVVMRFLLALGSAGDVRTTTMKALSQAEFEEIARKL